MDLLKELRDQLDQIDSKIVYLLDERMNIVDRIGTVKKELHKNITDKTRESVVLKHVESKCRNVLLKENIRNIYKAIIETSKIDEFFHQSQFCPFRRIGIVGTGLMGGSICKEIKTKDRLIEIDVISQDTEDNSIALREGWVDKQYDWEEFIRRCDLIVLATPISSIISLAEKIKKVHAGRQKLVVIDIASVKKEIVEAFERLTDGQIEFIGTHPMAGKEGKGFVNSRATLYVNKTWIVVPHAKNDRATIRSVEEFIHFLGANPVLLDREEHDRQAALILHIPYMIAKSYLDFISSVNPASLTAAGPEFDAFTQITHNPEMSEEILEHNENIEKYMQEWLEKFGF